MSAPRTVIRGVAAPLLRDNVDTDQIIPKHHLIAVERKGLANGLFSEWRFAPDGAERPDFVLNQPPYRQAKILVAGDNFGCGSSREHAVWALQDFGIEAVLAESFGSIFEDNAAKNALATIRLGRAQLESLARAIARAPGAATAVDLERCVVRAPDGEEYPFELAPARRRALVEGRDEIADTLARSDRIAEFQLRDRRARPWVYELSFRRGAAPGSVST